MSIPPPLPPGQSRSEQMVDAFAHRGAAPPAAPPPKPGMSGCAIAAIIGAVVLVLGLFVVGILAAIALPAYQQYEYRAQVQRAYVVAEEWQPRIDAHFDEQGTCPTNAQIGLGDKPVHSIGLRTGSGEPGRADFRVRELDNGYCGVEISFRTVERALDRTTLILQSTGNGWDCLGGTLPTPYRPSHCRSFNTSPEDSAP